MSILPFHKDGLGTCRMDCFEEDSLRFQDTEGSVIGCLATWNGKRLVMQSEPFTYDKMSGTITLLTPQNEKKI